MLHVRLLSRPLPVEGQDAASTSRTTIALRTTTVQQGRAAVADENFSIAVTQQTDAMNAHSSAIPILQNSKKLFLTEAGIATKLIFERGLSLPDFASFPLVLSEEGREILRENAKVRESCLVGLSKSLLKTKR